MQTVLNFNNGTIIYADDRELRSPVCRKLFELKAEIKPIRLEVGDYIVSKRVCVERKTVSDFVNSMIDKRLFQQAKDLSEQFEKPIIIVEGAGDIFGQRNVHPNAIRGAIASLIIDFGIPILQTNDGEDTAHMIHYLARREQEERNVEVALRGKRSGLTEKQQQEFLVEGLPLVGPKLAKRLLTKFKSVEGVFTANEGELKKVGKIGDKKANVIRKIIAKNYNGD
jgi:Fanconi anemia group M protein